MKKALILAYDFLPYSSAGAQRPYSWFKYLKEFGVYPVIVTRHWNEGIKTPLDYVRDSNEQSVSKEKSECGLILKVPYKTSLRDKLLLKYGFDRFVFLRKLLSLFYLLAQYVTFIGDNRAGIYREARKYLRENKCDVIIATGEPFVLFRYAALLSREFDVPWIADYRDDWATTLLMPNSNFCRTIVNKLIFALYARNLEKVYLRNARLIITVMPELKSRLAVLHKDKRIEIAYNGFSMELFDAIEKEPQNSTCFEIAYSGTLYDFQPLELFLEGYKKFIENTGCSRTRAVFYGLEYFPKQKERLCSYAPSLEKMLFTTEKLPHAQVVNELRKANLFLLLSTKDMFVMPMKTFDYLMLNRKIMLVGDGASSLAKILDECNGGIICTSAEEVAKTLQQLYLEFLEKGFVAHQSKNCEQYNRKNQARIFAGLIKECTSAAQ